MTDRGFDVEGRPVLLARHLSLCGVCGHRIVPDEEITSLDGSWVHLSCADDDLGDAA